MENERKKTHNYKEYFVNTVFPIIFYGGLAGIFTGVVVTFFLFAAEKISHLTFNIYVAVIDNPAYIPLLFLGLIILAVIMFFIIFYTPDARGGGIPQTEGVLRGILTFKWLRVLIATIIGSFISFFAGLSLGSEGPSIQIGTTTADGASFYLKSKLTWRRYILTGGASAGLAVAFKAPLTGIIFAIEEVHKRVTPMIILTAASSVVFASLTSEYLLGLLNSSKSYMFDVGTLFIMPLSNFWYLIILGIFLGIAAAVYNKSTIKLQAIAAKLKRKHQLIFIMIAFVATGIAGLLSVDTLGGGYNLIISAINMDFSIQLILILLIVKFLLTLLSNTSGSTGGIFVPMLALGALVGGGMGKLFIAMGLDAMYYKTIVIISMSAFMAGVVKAPITAMILIVEVTGQLSSFLFTGITIFIVVLISELLEVEPLYDKLLGITIKNRFKGQKRVLETMEITVQRGSSIVNKSVREILWPANCQIMKIYRENLDGSNRDGERKIREGDVLTIQVESFKIQETKDYITMLAERDEGWLLKKGRDYKERKKINKLNK